MYYPKTANLLERSEETHKLIYGAYRSPAFEQVQSWLVTEKIDGTNIRLSLDFGYNGPRLTVAGRTDKASLPTNFEQEALGQAGPDTMVDALMEIEPGCDPDIRMTVYGEGYGPGIQKGGGMYAERKSLRIFDVVTFKQDESDRWRPLWRTWADVELVAEALGLPTVPVLGVGYTTSQVESLVEAGLTSRVSADEFDMNKPCPAEGVVARTDPYLFTFRGDRVMFKYKGNDLPS